MIKSKDVRKSIVKKIHENFEDKVLNSEATSDLKRSYFFVYMENFERESYSNSNDYVTYTAIVQYRKGDKIKLAEIGDKLSEIFNYKIDIDGLPILITNNAWSIKDDSLFFGFQISFYVNKIKNEVNREMMKKLFINYERGDLIG